MIEFWDSDHGSFRLYTDEDDLMRELERDFPNPTCYYDADGNPFGWQFLLPSRLWKIMARRAGLKCDVARPNS